jgi:uncharacterized protein with FMN-binding domain
MRRRPGAYPDPHGPLWDPLVAISTTRSYNLLNMAQSGSNKKAANNLVSASCAAVLAVYVAGYARTQSAANRFSARVAERRAAIHSQSQNSSPITEAAPKPSDAATHIDSQASTETVSTDPGRDALFKANPIASAEPIPTTANAPGGAVELRDSHTVSPAETPAPISPAPVFGIPDAAPVANAPAEPPPAPAAEHRPNVAAAEPPAPIWKDGTYTGWGYSRHGDIEAAVVIEGGRIASATISQCRTRYSCSVIDRLPPQVAQRQSPDVDYVSGATQSADAFYGAVLAALSKAK